MQQVLLANRATLHTVLAFPPSRLPSLAGHRLIQLEAPAEVLVLSAPARVLQHLMEILLPSLARQGPATLIASQLQALELAVSQPL